MRAAMVGGAAYYTGKKVQEGREADYDRDARIAELEQEQAMAAAPPPAPAGGAQEDTLAQLEKLGQLKQQGILTDEEFAEQKRKLLAGS